MGESEGGSSSATPDEHGDAPGVSCVVCDAEVDTAEWYPVTQERDEDGNLHIHPFCSEACRDEWLEEQDD